MFGNKKSASTTSSPTGTSTINTIVEGTTVDGTMNTRGDLRVDGIVTGQITCGGKLIVGPTGNIDGEVSCQNAVIEGSFSGILKVTSLLDVRDTAKIKGDIEVEKISMMDGAVFNGTTKMTNNAYDSSQESD